MVFPGKSTLFQYRNSSLFEQEPCSKSSEKYTNYMVYIILFNIPFGYLASGRRNGSSTGVTLQRIPDIRPLTPSVGLGRKNRVIFRVISTPSSTISKLVILVLSQQFSSFRIDPPTLSTLPKVSKVNVLHAAFARQRSIQLSRLGSLVSEMVSL